MYLQVLYNGREIYEHLREYYFLKKDCATSNSLIKITVAYSRHFPTTQLRELMTDLSKVF
jgi:hypothetical protein